MRTMLIWLFFVLVVSVIPIGQVPSPGFDVDLLFHFVIYAITCMLFISILGGNHGASRPLGVVLALSVLLAAGYGAIIEVVQGELGTRQFSAADIVANLAGALAAAGYVALRRYGR